MEQKKIFVTGVAGFLGSHLAEAFLADGHQVVGCDKHDRRLPRQRTPEKSSSIRSIANDVSKLRELMKDVDTSSITAPPPRMKGSPSSGPHLVTTHIVTASTGVISAAIANKVKRFVMCSSMARYGLEQSPLHRRHDSQPARPLRDRQAHGRVDAEEPRRTSTAWSGWSRSRTTSSGRARNTTTRTANVASIFINLMLNGRQPYIYGDGNQMRCFSFVFGRDRAVEEDGLRPQRLARSHQHRARRR